METHLFYSALDPFLIWFYRRTGNAGVDFVIGTFVLAFFTVLVGTVISRLAFRLSRRHVSMYADEAAQYQALSMEALKAGEKKAFKAANLLANDAFGHSFFQHAALSASFLCPVFFSLAWMQYRFLDVEFPIPGVNASMGFIGVFIILYVIAFFLFKLVKSKLPFFAV